MRSVRADPGVKRWVRLISNHAANPVYTRVTHDAGGVALAVFATGRARVPRVHELLAHRQGRVDPVAVKEGVRAHGERSIQARRQTARAIAAVGIHSIQHLQTTPRFPQFFCVCPRPVCLGKLIKMAQKGISAPSQRSPWCSRAYEAAQLSCSPRSRDCRSASCSCACSHRPPASSRGCCAHIGPSAL